MENVASPAGPRWLHTWSILTVCAAAPLLALGAEVTTKGVGMVDSRPFVFPTQAMQEIEANPSAGFRIEHLHRLFGSLVGICGIVLAGAFLLKEPRWWLKALAVVAFLLICIQGVFGMLRIGLNNPTMAMVHGVFAAIVIATLVSVMLFSSPGWIQAGPPGDNPPLRRWSLACAFLVFGQLVLGGLIRHHPSLLAGRLHLIGAFIVLAALLWLMHLSFEAKEEFARTCLVLGALLGIQLLLGVEAWVSWLSRFLDPARAIHEPVVVHWLRSAHYVVGVFVFATAVVFALKAHRGVVVRLPKVALFEKKLEGAA